jgi:hypothetical protein
MPAPAWIRVTAVVSALTISALVAGCSSGDDATPTGATDLGDQTAAVATDPCSLLTIEQIDDATGWTLPEGEQPEIELEGDRTVCNWEDLREGGTVQVQLDRGAGRAGFDGDRSELDRPGCDAAEVVDIVGATEAVELAASGILTMLVGEDVVQLAIIGADLDGVEQRVLAADVAEALR